MDKEVYKNYEIIDAHAHIFPEKIAAVATESIGNFYDIPMTGCGLSDKLVESGRTIGVKRYLVCSTATTQHQISAINHFISGECTLHPEFYGFGTTHADSDDVAADVEQILALGLHGVKLHPDFQKFNADSPEAYKIYEAIEGVLPVLIHCGDNRYDFSDPRRIARIHKDFPKLKLMAAHLGGYQQWDEAIKCLRGDETLKFDVSSSLAFLTPERAAEIIHIYGSENCFFGSDFPMWDHEEELERFLALGLTEEENRMIFSENIKNFLDL